ncbi:MAG: hypothetical protein BGO21_07830 [Dyadobacter sp. 50-39]|uniref:HD domain-containing protein n=1 Tax=Dyadobacter sp. 50-39 TaxID=1895756 RepID=UPI0009628FBA|nr:HD domain-containing protein [Dyadobacter sp. 50-39]OJV20483.1 MAG: hypothetical protein BGO21_07830 [Dyadobacter sp. 50-39]
MANETFDPEPRIESILSAYSARIAGDLDKYRNHVYRVYRNCQQLDPNTFNHKVYAIAAAFHDVGIWTDHTIDYLNPSVAHAMDYLHNEGEHALQSQVATMIYWHHKTSIYKGPFAHTTEVFRKADWADVSLGLLAFGMERKRLRATRQQFPNRGFHVFLVGKVFANFFRHPLNPLPMFKS